MADFTIERHGTITLLKTLTDDCAMWVVDNVAIEGWQWFGGAIAVEPRYEEALVDGLTEAGFTQEEE